MAEWVRGKSISSYMEGDNELGRVCLLPNGRWVASLGYTEFISEHSHRANAERAVEKKINA